LPRVCDYEGSRYRTEFWENQNRQYEDLVERIALKRLLPPSGKRLIEIGAGFGRLVDLYDGYDQIILTDYARTQLEEAQRYLGHDDRFVFAVADVYHMPFVDHLFDALVMVRVMHHLTDVPAALSELYRIIGPQGTAVIEHASKRHIKSVLRWLLKRQAWNPFAPEPHEFVELNIDFHPTWMQQRFSEAGFSVEDIRAVSYYRVPLLKRLLPSNWLATLDGWTQPTGRWFQYSPSLFLKAIPGKGTVEVGTGFFKCPVCHHPQLEPEQTYLLCLNCQRRWEIRDGIYDFKTPMS
jgi:ubiquinone/menaquinone biosynthesis C-methylase UbiE